MSTAYSRKILTCVTLVALGTLFANACLRAASPPEPASLAKSGRLVVHEWGTFLSVQGSDGSTLGGMVDSDEPLPTFVERRSIQTWQRSSMFQKMETPVTYFYTDKPRDVEVRVDMPKGILTHWYPMVSWFGPDPAMKTDATKTQSFIYWRRVHLTPNAHLPLQEGLMSLTLKAPQANRRGVLSGRPTRPWWV